MKIMFSGSFTMPRVEQCRVDRTGGTEDQQPRIDAHQQIGEERQRDHEQHQVALRRRHAAHPEGHRIAQDQRDDDGEHGVPDRVQEDAEIDRLELLPGAERPAEQPAVIVRIEGPDDAAIKPGFEEAVDDDDAQRDEEENTEDDRDGRQQHQQRAERSVYPAGAARPSRVSRRNDVRGRGVVGEVQRLPGLEFRARPLSARGGSARSPAVPSFSRP